MAPDPSPRFEREYGCTEAEWQRWLREVVDDADRLAQPAGGLDVRVGDGQLQLRWQTLPPRVIALVRLPRLQARFAFDGVSGADRQAFMQRFDLHLQRGGG